MTLVTSNDVSWFYVTLDDRIQSLLHKLNIELRIPKCMADGMEKGLVINTYRKECSRFLEFVYHTWAQVECPYTRVTMFDFHNEENGKYARYFIEHMNLNLEMD